jgi:hypothetical protein
VKVVGLTFLLQVGPKCVPAAQKSKCRFACKTERDEKMLGLLKYVAIV